MVSRVRRVSFPAMTSAVDCATTPAIDTGPVAPRSGDRGRRGGRIVCESFAHQFDPEE